MRGDAHRALLEPMGAQESWLGGDPAMAAGPGGGGRIVMGGSLGGSGEAQSVIDRISFTEGMAAGLVQI